MNLIGIWHSLVLVENYEFLVTNMNKLILDFEAFLCQIYNMDSKNYISLE
jgi:hypothetical protein